MLINLRNALMAGKRTPTAKDYVHPGLIAMWDGIENAGWGTHNDTTATWTDLINGYDAVDSSKNQFGSWSDDGFTFTESHIVGYLSSSNASCFLNKDFPISGVGNWTYECVCNVDSAFMSGVARGIFGNMGASSSQRGVCGFQKKDGSSLWHGTYDGGDLLAVGESVLTFGSRQSLVLVSNATSGKYHVYVNGSLANTASGTHHSPNINGILIGASFGYVSGVMTGREDSVARRFVGTIHALRVSDYAMSAAQIAANYALDAERFSLP